MVDEEQQQEKQITKEPQAAGPMVYNKNESQSSRSSGDTEVTVSEVGSGYHRDTNECSEFCIDLFGCFGVCNGICPSSEEGCITSCATFIGNLCFSCCKC